MPGPKMGPRPADFDEMVVRQSPTYQRWLSLPNGGRLRYACRDFVKGRGDDEERLMRRIMIARRNNLRDHDALKRARAVILTTNVSIDKSTEPSDIFVDNATEVTSLDIKIEERTCSQVLDNSNQEESVEHQSLKVKEERHEEQQHEGHQKSFKRTKRRNPKIVSLDRQVEQEMDVAAVEATRSYKMWQVLEDGKEFVYNQKYIKGRPTHDWLLRKNIWRRMRYRRQNRKMVQALFASDGLTTASSGGDAFGSILTGDHRQDEGCEDDVDHNHGAVGAGLVDEALLASAAAAVDEVQHIHKSVVDAAVAAAESYVKSNVDKELGINV